MFIIVKEFCDYKCEVLTLFEAQTELNRVTKIRKGFHVFHWCYIWSGIICLIPVNSWVYVSYNVTPLEVSLSESPSYTFTMWTGSRTPNMTIQKCFLIVFVSVSVSVSLSLQNWSFLFNPMQVPTFDLPLSRATSRSGFSLQFLGKFKGK